MTEPLYTWAPAQFRAHEVLVAHQRKDIGGCHCGEFGNKPSDLGRSYAAHVVDELGRAGIVLVAHWYDPETGRCTCGALDHPDWGATA